MDMQNVSNLQIPDGVVRTVHDKNSRLLWGRVAYDTKYAGNIVQNGAPTPDTPIPVQVVTGVQTAEVHGKNLFDKNSIIAGKLVNRNYGTLNDLDGYGATDFIKVIPGEKYSYTGFNYWYSAGYDKDKNYVTSLQNAQTIIIPEGVYYIRASLQLTNLEIGQFEQSVSPTPYESYQSQPYPISLGSIELCKIGTYQDYIYKSGNDWFVHKEVGKVTFTGTEDWTLAATYTNNKRFVCNDIITSSSNNTVLSDYFTQGVGGSDTENVAINGTTRKIMLTIRNSTVPNLADFKTWLGTNTPSVYYILATSTNTKITDSTLMGQLDAVHQWLTRYGYNATVTGNLPLIVDRTNL